MLRLIALIAALALALPTLASAQPHEEHKGPPPKGPSGPPPKGPVGPPHGPVVHGPVVPGGPGFHPPGGPGFHPPGGPQFGFRGHNFNRVHIAPFIYPPGFGYRRWAPGLILPPLFLAPAYYYTDWAALGLDAPPPGTEWVRYGPDLLLVNIATGQVIDVAYGVFY
jgi:hypothetical protein